MIMKRWKLILFTLIGFIIATSIVAICAIIVFDFDVLGENDTYSLAMLNTKIGYVIDIRTDSFREAMAPIYCTVTKNGETIFPLQRAGFTSKPRKLEFALVEGGEKNEIIAIIEKEKPHVVLAIYDLENRKSWYENQAVRRELLQHLNKYKEGRPFIWLGHVKSTPQSEIHY